MMLYDGTPSEERGENIPEITTLEQYLEPHKIKPRFQAMLDEIITVLDHHQTYSSDDIYDLYPYEIGTIAGALIHELERKGRLEYIEHIRSKRTDKSHYRKIGLYKVVRR